MYGRGSRVSVKGRDPSPEDTKPREGGRNPDAQKKRFVWNRAENIPFGGKFRRAGGEDKKFYQSWPGCRGVKGAKEIRKGNGVTGTPAERVGKD